MKKSIALFLITGMATSCFSASQSKASDIEKICKGFGIIAQNFMELRQEGRTLWDAFTVKDKVSKKLPALKDKEVSNIIIEAYDKPYEYTEKGKQKSVREFSIKWEVACYGFSDV